MRLWQSSQNWIEKYRTYMEKDWETTELKETWNYINIKRD